MKGIDPLLPRNRDDGSFAQPHVAIHEQIQKDSIRFRY